MLPVISAFKAAHRLTDVTVVADADDLLEADQITLQASGLSFILGTRIPFDPDVVREWRDKHPDEQIADGTVFTTGQVAFDGHDVHATYALKRSRIGMVPQDDVVHRQLTVDQALSYAAQLRLPPDTSKTDRRAIVEARRQTVWRARIASRIAVGGPA